MPEVSLNDSPTTAINTEETDPITQKLEKKSVKEASVDEKASIGGEFSGLAVEGSNDESNTDVYDFDAFIRRMRHPSCKPILENIKR